MKGPLGRLKFPIVRRWQCPACGRRVTSGVQAVNMECGCRAREAPSERTWMRLVEEEPPVPRMPTGVVPRTWKKVAEPREARPEPPAPPAAATPPAQPEAPAIPPAAAADNAPASAETNGSGQVTGS